MMHTKRMHGIYERENDEEKTQTKKHTQTRNASKNKQVKRHGKCNLR